MNNAGEKLPFDALVYLMLDGEASPKQQKQFNQYIANSIYHSDCFEAEKELHTFLKKHIKRKAAPADLLVSIENQFYAQLEAEEAQNESEKVRK